MDRAVLVFRTPGRDRFYTGESKSRHDFGLDAEKRHKQYLANLPRARAEDFRFCKGPDGVRNFYRKDCGSRARLELATLRLTALKPNSLQFAGAG